MRHISTLTRKAPAKAQFESLLQLVGLLNSVLAFYQNVSNVFGIAIPQKSESNNQS